MRAGEAPRREPDPNKGQATIRLVSGRNYGYGTGFSQTLCFESGTAVELESDLPVTSG